MSDYDETFRALADPHRRRILSAVCEEPRVAGELANLVGLAPNAVSFHLKWLKSAGLVRVQRQGRFLRYHAVAAALADWRKHVRDLFPLEQSPRENLAFPLPSARRSRPAAFAREQVEAVAVAAEEAEPLPTELL